MNSEPNETRPTAYIADFNMVMKFQNIGPFSSYIRVNTGIHIGPRSESIRSIYTE